MKKTNYPLIIGTFILIVLFLISFYPEAFTTSDPYGKQRLSYSSGAEAGELVVPPIAPNKEYPWGTDEKGRDMRSLIFYGAKSTMAVAIWIGLCRFFISLPISIFAAYKNPFAIWLMKQFKTLFSAFPLVILILLSTKLDLFSKIFSSTTAMTSFLLIVLGWSRFADLLRKKVEEVLKKDFIEGEIAIGKNKFEIALQNIMPHIIPSIFVLLFLEIGMVLLLLSQLGVFGLLLNGGYYVGLHETLQVPVEFDWVSLLNLSYLLFDSGKTWMVLYPAAAFALSIVGFNLFGEGLRIEFEKRNSRIITGIRGVPSFLSPLRLIYEIRHFVQYKKRVYKKLAFYSGTLLLLFFPQAASPYPFDADNAMSIVEELSSPKYKGRLVGSPENRMAAEYIADRLEEYGLKPFGGQFIHEHEVSESYNINYSTFKVIGPDSKVTEYQFRKDYRVSSYEAANIQYPLQAITAADIDEIKNDNAYAHFRDRYKDVILICDVRKLNELIFNRVLNNIAYEIKPKGVIFIEPWESGKTIPKFVWANRTLSGMPVLSIAADKGDALLKQIGSVAHIEAESIVYKNEKVPSVIGYIPGTNEALKDEYIVVGSAIDYVGDDLEQKYPGALEAGGMALELEAARKIAQSGIKPERTIIFAFWNGTWSQDRGSRQFVHDYIDALDKKAIYIDIRNFIHKGSKGMILDTSKVMPSNKTAQAYIKAAKQSAKRNGIGLSFGMMPTLNTEDFISFKKEAIILDGLGTDKIVMLPEDDISIIDKKKVNQAGQMVLDMLVEIMQIE